MRARRTSPDFVHLLSPGQIGPISLSNRIVLAAMDMNLCDDGAIVEHDVEHFVARAAGGTAMIVTGACAVAYPQGATSYKEPGLSEDRFIPGLRMLADAVHEAGSLLCVQMTHHGKVARIDTACGRALLVPSAPRQGPGGMESARVARERGHRVTLLESGDRLGGSAWFSQLTTPANGPLLDWQRHELERVGVVVQLRHTATPDSIADLRPSAVVLATGAHRGLPSVPGAELAHVHTGDTLRALLTGSGDAGHPGAFLKFAGLLGRLTRATRNPKLIRWVTKKFLPVGKNVAVIGGSLVGLELAEFLAERGRSVTLLEAGKHVGLPMALPRRWTAVRRAEQHGVRILREAVLEEITADRVRYRQGEDVAFAAADLVVVASEVECGAPLADELSARGIEVRVVGDAETMGYIQGAIHSAWQVAGQT